MLKGSRKDINTHTHTRLLRRVIYMKQRGNFVVAFMIGNRNYGRRQTFYLLGWGGGGLANTVPGIRWAVQVRDVMQEIVS